MGRRNERRVTWRGWWEVTFEERPDDWAGSGKMLQGEE